MKEIRASKESGHIFKVLRVGHSCRYTCPTQWNADTMTQNIIWTNKWDLPGKLWIKGAMNGEYVQQILKHILNISNWKAWYWKAWYSSTDESREQKRESRNKQKHTCGWHLKWWRKKWIMWSVVLNQHRSHLEKTKLDPCFTPYTWINSECKKLNLQSSIRKHKGII